MVEQRTENPCVPGSIPGGTTNKTPTISLGFFFEMFVVYVLYSEKAKCKYTGYTSDIERRLKEHNEGLLGKFTKGKGPWKLIYQEKFENKRAAIIREKELKTGKGRDHIKRITGY